MLQFNSFRFRFQDKVNILMTIQFIPISIPIIQINNLFVFSFQPIHIIVHSDSSYFQFQFSKRSINVWLNFYFMISTMRREFWSDKEENKRKEKKKKTSKVQSCNVINRNWIWTFLHKYIQYISDSKPTILIFVVAIVLFNIYIQSHFTLLTILIVIYYNLCDMVFQGQIRILLASSGFAPWGEKKSSVFGATINKINNSVRWKQAENSPTKPL